ncbi:MAG: hypothetical protein V4608_00535 [Bacteroidota bacterium]
MMNQTFYTLQINAISTCFEIKVNDIPLHTESTGYSTAVEIPINHLLVKGLNLLQISIWPSKHENEFVGHTKSDFEIFYRDINDDREQRKLLATAEFPDYITDETLKTSTLKSKTEFQVSLPTEIPLWTISPVLKLNEPTVNEVMDIYKEYFNALKSKNIDAVLKLTGAKNKVYADTSYKSLNTHVGGIRESLTTVFADAENELIDFDIQIKKPELHAFGKLVTIMNDENRSPLQFYNAETEVTTSYKIYLCKKDGKMTIVL